MIKAELDTIKLDHARREGDGVAAMNALVKSIDRLDDTVRAMAEQNRQAAQSATAEHQQLAVTLTRVIENLKTHPSPGGPAA